MAEAKKWQEASGPENDVVISTRIRLARNLPKLPFPCRMNDEQSRVVEQAVCRAVEHSSTAISGSLRCVELQDLTKTEKISMVERHLVSPEFIGSSEGRALFLSNDERVSIMVNEEDHLRIQSMQEGLALEKAYQIANALDDALNTSLHFAFDDTLGYLTQCPTNLGTGMRASVMLHLPSLQSSGQLSRISSHLSKLGLTLRGTYGEGSEPVGALYQLSNQVSLGLSEEEAITNLKSITQQLIEQERTARQKNDAGQQKGGRHRPLSGHSPKRPDDEQRRIYAANLQCAPWYLHWNFAKYLLRNHQSTAGADTAGDDVVIPRRKSLCRGAGYRSSRAGAQCTEERLIICIKNDIDLEREQSAPSHRKEDELCINLTDLQKKPIRR
jgi:protein arginine kinase